MNDNEGRFGCVSLLEEGLAPLEGEPVDLFLDVVEDLGVDGAENALHLCHQLVLPEADHGHFRQSPGGLWMFI